MVLKLHNCNAWQRSRWKRKKKNEDRGAWEQSCLAFQTELSILESSRVTLHLMWLEYHFKMIGGVLFLFLICTMCFICFPNSPQTRLACVFCFITLCKKVVAWDKRSPWASAGCERKSFGLHKATVDTIQCFYNVINGKRQQITDWS